MPDGQYITNGLPDDILMVFISKMNNAITVYGVNGDKKTIIASNLDEAIQMYKSTLYVAQNL